MIGFNAAEDIPHWATLVTQPQKRVNAYGLKGAEGILSMKIKDKSKTPPAFLYTWR